jgi:1L-myo-inositol 1-phosphate cytidylyltransferase / CDP-L-myo-inositol myo-inositolphosphotransferase
MSSTAWERSDRPNTPNRTLPSLAILNACNSGAWKRVGGIPLVARLLFHLNALGLKRVVLLGDSDHPPQSLEKWRGGIQIEYQQVKKSLPGALLSTLHISEHFIYIDAVHLVDPRLLQALLFASDTTICHMDAADRKKPIIRAGLLSKEDLLVWSDQGIPALIGTAVPLLPERIAPYCPEMRGPATPYFLEVSTERDAVEATHLLIRHQQKQVMDLPSQYLHPPFENALTFLLLKTPVSPDGVTLMVAILGLLIAWLFWHGYFIPGALLTFLVDILDGVDGKLARTKLQFSWLGKHEDIIDYFYENSWYVALGAGLSTLTGGYLPLLFAALLVLADTADNVFYTLAGKWYGKSIDLFSRFDRNFRRIAGRRCVYGALFIIGFSLGYPFPTFVITTLWALVTATIHGIRLRHYRQTPAAAC